MKPFNLAECFRGVPCVTKSGKTATFLFRDILANAPIVMSIGNSMENYTVEGKHLYNDNMDLSMKEPHEYDIYSPTRPDLNSKTFIEAVEGKDSRQCVSLGFANENEPVKAKAKKRR